MAGDAILLQDGLDIADELLPRFHGEGQTRRPFGTSVDPSFQVAGLSCGKRRFLAGRHDHLVRGWQLGGEIQLALVSLAWHQPGPAFPALNSMFERIQPAVAFLIIFVVAMNAGAFQNRLNEACKVSFGIWSGNCDHDRVGGGKWDGGSEAAGNQKGEEDSGGHTEGIGEEDGVACNANLYQNAKATADLEAPFETTCFFPRGKNVSASILPVSPRGGAL